MSITLQIAVMPFLCVQDYGDTLRHRGFFSDYKVMLSHIL